MDSQGRSFDHDAKLESEGRVSGRSPISNQVCIMKEASEDKKSNNQQQLKMEHLDKGIVSHQFLSASAKSKADVVSGYSFSRFEPVSECSDKDKFSDMGSAVEPPMKSGSKRQAGSRVPTSTRVISSNKIIEEPIQLKNWSQERPQVLNQPHRKQQYAFQYRFLSQTEILEKFAQFAIEKGMELKTAEKQLTVIKKIPFFKSLLSLCFPNRNFEHEVYELTLHLDRRCKMTLISGKEENYSVFKDDFLLSLWQAKLLACGNLNENLRFFLSYFNKTYGEGQKTQQNLRSRGYVDSLKTQVQKALKIQSAQFKRIKDMHHGQSHQKQGKCAFLQVQIPQMSEIKIKIRHTEDNLKILLENELKKQEKAKKEWERRLRPIGQMLNADQAQPVNQQQKEQVQMTPSVERMLMGTFYSSLGLGQLVKKNILRQQDINAFQKKKMIIKGSLTVPDILKYLQLQQFSKSQTQGDSTILNQSIKILSSLKYQSYPCPHQILEIASIFKSTALKEIQWLSSWANCQKVKLQDHSDEERTLLQFCIFGIIMCQNRDIYPTIETAFVFHSSEEPGVKISDVESLKIVKILRKAIRFVRDQWQL